MRKHRNKSLLLILCALPIALTGCGIRYAVHDHRHGYHRPPTPPPKYHRPHHGHGHHGHPPGCGCRRCR